MARSTDARSTDARSTDARSTDDASYMKVFDESMSAIRFQTAVKGNLPHLSYISANQNHWVNSIILWNIMLLGHFYSYRYITIRKV